MVKLVKTNRRNSLWYYVYIRIFFGNSAFMFLLIYSFVSPNLHLTPDHNFNSILFLLINMVGVHIMNKKAETSILVCMQAILYAKHANYFVSY